MNVQFAEEVPLFNQMVMRLPLGRPITAVVVRDGHERTLTVVPEERASVETPVKEIPELGITASNISFWSAKELRRSNRDGVRYVTSAPVEARQKPSRSCRTTT